MAVVSRPTLVLGAGLGTWLAYLDDGPLTRASWSSARSPTDRQERSARRVRPGREPERSAHGVSLASGYGEVWVSLPGAEAVSPDAKRRTKEIAMTNQPQHRDYRSETTRERAEAMSPGPGTPLGTQEDERQREVAETVNLGSNTDALGLDARAQHRARQVNPGAHSDLPDDDFDRGVASRMNLGPQE
jgi:hypothetical protein